MYNAKDAIACEISELTIGNQSFGRESLVKKLRAIWEYLPEIPEPSHIGTNIVQDPWLTYPYDKHLITDLISMFENSGWKIEWRVRESEVEAGGLRANPRVCFGHPSNALSVICEFDDSLIGSTCTRKVIGKKMVEADIVEFVCKE